MRSKDRFTYFRARDESTAPPPGGPVALGSLLMTLDELRPMDADNHEPVPAGWMHTPHRKTGVNEAVSKDRTCTIGFVARLFGLPVSETSNGVSYSSSDADNTSFEAIETITFEPPEYYIRRAVARRAIQGYMRETNPGHPVYMITGLKVAYGASSDKSRARARAYGGGLTFSAGGVELSPEVGLGSSSSEASSHETSSPYIKGFRVRKVFYMKGAEQAKHELWDKGATMLDGTRYREPMQLCHGDVTAADFEEYSPEGYVEVEDPENEKVRWILSKASGINAEGG